jgi:hypothetical protein
MTKQTHEGICHICGINGPLSFEHIPPRAASNNRPVITIQFNNIIELGPDAIARGPVQQKGMGANTLCYRCNNDTGAWYGTQFVNWCYQGMEILKQTSGNPSTLYLKNISPLPIIKQIATMFFSVNSEKFQVLNNELVRFVLNKEINYLSPKYRFFVYLNTTAKFRKFGATAIVDINSRKISILSEITFPPYGYVMTIDSEPPDDRVIEITHFGKYYYRDNIDLSLNLPVLPTHLPFPGDYRDKDQIYRDAGHK